MAERERFKAIKPVAIIPREGGAPDYVLVGDGRDPDTAMAETAVFAEEVGASSWQRVELNSNGRVSRRSFHFSGDKWKAPWQPKGPKPNWQEPGEADPSEPIN